MSVPSLSVSDCSLKRRSTWPRSLVLTGKRFEPCRSCSLCPGQTWAPSCAAGLRYRLLQSPLGQTDRLHNTCSKFVELLFIQLEQVTGNPPGDCLAHGLQLLEDLGIEAALIFFRLLLQGLVGGCGTSPDRKRYCFHHGF